MFTILEKTLLLKTVDLFQEIPGELLSQVSKISKARPYEKDSAIFRRVMQEIQCSLFLKALFPLKRDQKKLQN